MHAGRQLASSGGGGTDLKQALSPVPNCAIGELFSASPACHKQNTSQTGLTLLLVLEVLNRLPRCCKLARRALQRHRVLRHRLQLLLQRLPHLRVRRAWLNMAEAACHGEVQRWRRQAAVNERRRWRRTCTSSCGLSAFRDTGSPAMAASGRAASKGRSAVECAKPRLATEAWSD